LLVLNVYKAINKNTLTVLRLDELLLIVLINRVIDELVESNQVLGLLQVIFGPQTG